MKRPFEFENPETFSSILKQNTVKKTFESFPIEECVLRGIKGAGFEFCTPIQSQTLPIALAGKDVAGQAQTGTGKTAAFLIATFCHLLKKPSSSAKPSSQAGPRCLIIAPTRELARQIERDALILGKYCDFKTVCVHGGIDYDKQRDQIKRGVDILIATPGRLIDYHKQKFFSLKKVEVLVIDEADRLFDMGFRQDIRYLLRRISSYDKRLSMIFSATLSHEVMELCYEHTNSAEKVAVEPGKIVVDEVEQSLYHVGTDEKLSLLLGILKQEAGEKVIIFCNTKRSAEELARTLEANGYSAAQISGDIHQRTRIRVLEKFSQGDLNILIATDVASRGLHIDNVTHVINYELPQDAEDYIHRIGRTARAGAKGTAISMSCEDYVHGLERIEEVLKFKIPVVWPGDEMYLEVKKPPPRPRKPSPPVHNKKSPPRRDGKSSQHRSPRRPAGRGTSRPKH